MVITVEDFCRETRNYFQTAIYTGSYTIVNGSLNLDFLQPKQYFRIAGSVFNDGVYEYPSNTLIDETFNGTVWAMMVPNAVIALLDDINKYQAKLEKNADVIDSPFQSESFGGYSYSKTGSGNRSDSGTSGADDFTWQAKFKNRLNRYRKAREV